MGKRKVLTLLCGLLFFGAGKAYGYQPECFVAGTKILMGDGSEMAIETIKAGDIVMSYDIEQGKMDPQTIAQVKSDWHSGEGEDYTIEITFSDGSKAECTNNHAYYVKGKGYASYLPDRTKREYGFTVERLEKGDRVFKARGTGGVEEAEIIRIEERRRGVRTYDIVNLEKNHNFFANGMLVHNSGSGDSGTGNGGGGDGEGGGGGGGEPPVEPPPDPEDPGIRPEGESIDGESDGIAAEDGAIPDTGEGQGDGAKTAGDLAEDTGNRGKDAGQQAAEDAEGELNDTVEENGDALAKGTAEEKGDPVLVTSGQYRMREDDVSIAGKLEEYTVKRTYTSENPVAGSLGKGWTLGPDTRIIRGTDLTRRELERRYKRDYMDPLETALDRYIAAFGTAWGTGDRWRQTGTIYRARLETLVRLEARAESNKNRAEALYTKAQWPGSRTTAGTTTRVLQVRERAGTILANTRAKRRRCEGAVTEIERELARIAGLETWLAEARAAWEAYRAEAEKSDRIMTGNGAVLFAGTPEYYYGTGFGTYNVVDEEGLVWLYESEDGETWKPREGSRRDTVLRERRERADGGYVLYGPGGVKKYYDEKGLYRGEEDRAGNRREVTRNGGGPIEKVMLETGEEIRFYYEGGNLSQITLPEGEEIRYGYNGSMLSEVTDREGDAVRYTYEGSRLKRITKNDGSYIELTYGYDGTGGTKLVSATRQEEGGVERFEYYERMTRYINHSGVETKYYYDGKHRTVREEHGDGTIKEYEYNEIGKVRWERINGDLTEYRYDERGNLSGKWYSDGSREEWQWNGTDQKTMYSDRDGVRTGWTYDAVGNCVLTQRGGEVVFTGSYGSGGLLQTARQGNRAPEQYGYDSRGYPASRSAGGVSERWTNDALGRVTAYMDGAGREWRYAYAAKTRSEQTPTSLIRTYTYNNRKDLVSIVERDKVTGEERERRIEYDRRHLPVKETDGAGNETRYEYREDGQVIKKTQGEWEWAYTYDPGGRPTSVTARKAGSAAAYTERYEYNRTGPGEELRGILRPLSGGGEASTWYRFDPWGRVKSVTNAAGEESVRILSSGGRVITERGASDGSYAYTYDAAGRLIGAGREGNAAVSVGYNADGSIAWERDRNGEEKCYEYDGRGLLTREQSGNGEKRWAYDGAGRTAREETITTNAESGSGTYYRTWQYDDTNRKVTETDGGKYQTTWHYNAWEEVVRKVDGEGNSRGWAYDGAGRVIKEIDGYGRETSYMRNALGKVSKIKYADGSEERYEYNHRGQVEKIEDPAGIKWEGWYDEAGRLKKERGRPGIEKEYRYQRNAYGELVSEENRLGDHQSYGYDSEGRLIRRIAYSGKQAVAEYQNNRGRTTTRYSDGTETAVTRDHGGNITRVEGQTGIIRYRYDAGGRLITQTDEGSGERTDYGYDRAGRRIRMTSGNRDVFYTYGKNGEPAKVLDNPQCLSVECEYDVRGREVKRTCGNGARQETKYDPADRILLIRELDARRDLLRAEGYLYDEKGRRSHTVDERGRVTKYEYDSQSRLAAVYYPWSEEQTASDRKEAGEAGLMFTVNAGQGIRCTYTTEEARRLRDVLNQASINRGTLVGAGQPAWVERYTYDRNGNRATKTTAWGTINYRYDAENRLVSKGAMTYTYDKDGNLLSENGSYKNVRYEYNGQNRMTYSEVRDKISGDRMISGYRYDGLGRRTMTQDAGSETMRTVYDAFTFEVIREGVTFRDGSLTTRFAQGMMIPEEKSEGTRYRYIEEGDTGTRPSGNSVMSTAPTRYTGISMTLYGHGEAVAVSRSAGTGTRGGISYLGKDALGSVRSVTGNGGVIEERYEYDAFGKPLSGDLGNGIGLGYTGKPYDTATGLYNYGCRDYQPQAARFTTTDPVRDGNNWFAYVNNDPVNWVDPWGLSASDTNGQKSDKKDEPSKELAKVANGKAFPIGMSADDFGTNTLMSSEWGENRGSFSTPGGNTKSGHNGFDIPDPEGTRINAIGDGVVTTVGYDPSPTGYGNYAIIEHPTGSHSLYGHQSKVYVNEGQSVVAGQHIGNVGSTGMSTGPHLHFGWDGNGDGKFSRGDQADNPVPILFGMIVSSQ